MTDIIRVTPRIAPFRRAGLTFTSREPVTIPIETLTEEQQLIIANEPSFVVDHSSDDGATWAPFLKPWPVAKP